MPMILETPERPCPVAIARPTTWWRRWRGRLWSWLYALGLDGVGVYAYMTYQTGIEWEDRAEDLRGRADNDRDETRRHRERLSQTSQT